MSRINSALSTVAKVLLTGSMLSAASLSQAAITWTLPDGSPGTETSDGVTATLSAWTTTSTGANSEFVSTSLNSYTDGLGVGYEGNPQHAIDNVGAYEFILMVFDTPIVLTDLWIGWPDSGYDTDMSVLAYTGNGSYNSTDMTSLNSDRSDTSGSTRGLTNAGWELIGDPSKNNNLENVDSDQWQTLYNTGNVASSHWLIGSYNAHLSDAVSGLAGGNDYAKLKKVRGYEQPRTQVPAPGTLLLLSIGLLALRRRAQG